MVGVLPVGYRINNAIAGLLMRKRGSVTHVANSALSGKSGVKVQREGSLVKRAQRPEHAAPKDTRD
ncbi:hypothetical protein BH713_05930 [Enterobacter kobei]|uniref:Uncharacterized protein n=1 Tax=Enterobacter kobei TaxID=208224 RepID=A0ACC8S9N7_9ENTR|nr:hypothetical protein BH713_05930 [Enterobacter kobei]